MSDQGQWLSDYFKEEAAKIEPYKLRWQAVLNATSNNILLLNNPDMAEAVAKGAHVALLGDLYPYDGEAYVKYLQAKLDDHMIDKRQARRTYLTKLDTLADISAGVLGILNHDDLWNSTAWLATKKFHPQPAKVSLRWTRFSAAQRQVEQHINRNLELVSRYLVLAPQLATGVGGLYSNVTTIDYYEARFPLWLEAYAAVIKD